MKKTIISSRLSPHFQDYLEQSTKMYDYLQVLTLENDQQIQQWDMFGAYSSQKIINFVQLTKKDENFLPILAFEVQKISDYMKIKTILRPSTCFTLQQLLALLKTSKQQQKFLLVRLMIIMINQCTNTIETYKQMLNQFDKQCFQCQIYEVKKEFKIVLGVKDISLSKMNEEQSTRESLLTYFQKVIKQISQIEKPELVLEENSKDFDIQLIDFVRKLKKSTEKQQKHYQYSIYYQQALYQRVMSNFTSRLFDMITTTIIDLTAIILNEYLQQNNNFNSCFISCCDPMTKRPYKGQIYHNIECAHFEGLSYQTYSTQKICPICGQMIVFNAQRVKQVGRNVFQMILLNNPLNPHSNNLVYFFKQQVFTIKNSIQQSYLDAFNNYYHYQSYVKRTKNTHNRDEIANYHKYESINLYNKINGTKKYYSSAQLITTPVRGKYCHHWQFYDLKRVYSFLKKNKTQVFNCFVCLQQINVQQIIYLQEMSHLIELSRMRFSTNNSKEQYRYFINVDHQKKSNNKSKLLPLELYQTVEDPLCKSRYVKDFWQQEDRQIELSPQFCTFFFGK